MTPALILTSHGNMAYETLQSAKMIVGDAVQAEVMSMTESDGLSGSQGKMRAILDKIGDRPALILADLKGGTPCNTAIMEMGRRGNLRTVSGLNLAMVIEAALSQIEDVDQLAARLAALGKDAVEELAAPTLEGADEYEE